MLATNTSTLDVDAIAAASGRAAGRRRHALLQPREHHAAGRDRARRARPRDAALATAARGHETHRQDRRDRRQLLRLRRQPHAVRLRPREGTDAARGRLARADRLARCRSSAWPWDRMPSAISPVSTSAPACGASGAASPTIRASTASRTCWPSSAASARRPAPVSTATKARTRERTADPEVAALIRAEAARLGVAQRAIADGEIVERCVYALVNEGARILDEGIAAQRGRHRRDLVQRLWFPAHPRRPDVLRGHVGLPGARGRRESQRAGRALLDARPAIGRAGARGSSLRRWQAARAPVHGETHAARELRQRSVAHRRGPAPPLRDATTGAVVARGDDGGHRFPRGARLMRATSADRRCAR